MQIKQTTFYRHSGCAIAYNAVARAHSSFTIKIITNVLRHVYVFASILQQAIKTMMKTVHTIHAMTLIIVFINNIQKQFIYE